VENAIHKFPKTNFFTTNSKELITSQKRKGQPKGEKEKQMQRDIKRKTADHSRGFARKLGSSTVGEGGGSALLDEKKDFGANNKT